MFTLERVTKEYLDVVKEIVHSNPAYNIWENGSALRTDEELKQEFLHNNPGQHTYFIKADDTYIGLLDYIRENKNDNCTWLGLLMIHSDYQGYGYGTNAYYMFEDMLKQQGITALRLGVLKQNIQARKFWEGLGFHFFAEKQAAKGMHVYCFEKQL